MKSFWLAIGIFIFSATAVAAFTYFGAQESAALMAEAEAIQQNAWTSDATLTEERLIAFSERYESCERLLLLSVSENELRAVRAAIEKGKAAAKIGDGGLLHVTLSELCDSLMNVYDAVRFSPDGII